MNTEKKKILFVCTGNSCRSQIAEGYMRHYFGDAFEVFSAGLLPSHVNPKAIQVMKEVEIDISSHTSDSINDYLNTSFDYVITVCDDANESCPVFTGEVKNRLHWGFEDPSFAQGTEDEILDKFREARDLIAEKIKNYFKDIKE